MDVKTSREFAGIELVFRKTEHLIFIIFCFGLGTREDSLPPLLATCTLPGPPWDIPVFCWLPHGATHGCSPGTCQASALTALGCLQVLGSLRVFFLCFQERKALGNREVGNGPSMPQGQKPLLCLQWSEPKQ